MKYEYLKDLTSDVAFKAYGETLGKCFEHSAEALMGIMGEVTEIQAVTKVTIAAKGEDERDVLFNFLQEIIAAVEIEGLFFSKCKVTNIGETEVIAECYGEEITPEKEAVHVKALTNYLFDLEKKSIDDKEQWVATVSVDI